MGEGQTAVSQLIISHFCCRQLLSEWPRMETDAAAVAEAVAVTVAQLVDPPPPPNAPPNAKVSADDPDAPGKREIGRLAVWSGASLALLPPPVT